MHSVRQFLHPRCACAPPITLAHALEIRTADAGHSTISAIAIGACQRCAGHPYGEGSPPQNHSPRPVDLPTGAIAPDIFDWSARESVRATLEAISRYRPHRANPLAMRVNDHCVRIPMKPATDFDVNPTTHSDRVRHEFGVSQDKAGNATLTVGPASRVHQDRD
jgi:hypothetical protein